MAAEIQPQPLTRKPILLQRVEGSQEVVNMAVIVPKEEGVISVSEDRYGLLARAEVRPGFGGSGDRAYWSSFERGDWLLAESE